VDREFTDPCDIGVAELVLRYESSICVDRHFWREFRKALVLKGEVMVWVVWKEVVLRKGVDGSVGNSVSTVSPCISFGECR